MGIFNRDYMRGDASRLRPQDWSAVATLIVINVVVFLAWQVGGGRGGDLARFLDEHFTCSLSRLARGEVWTLLTSAFSQQETLHLLLNMLFLYVLGREVEEAYGKRRFLIFYCMAGIAGSSLYCLLIALGWPPGKVLGASGAVLGIAVVFTWFDPKRVLLLFGVLPMPVWILTSILVLMDMVNLVRSFGATPMDGEVAHGAHLGGALFGLLYVWADSQGFLPGFLAGKRRRRSTRSARPARPRQASPVSTPSSYSGRTAEEEQRLDLLLKKVGGGGLDCLTPEERDFLMEMSKRSSRS